MSSLQSAEMPICLALNRWGTYSVVHGFFATISRLGDGVFWYAAMLALAISGGARGMLAAMHMALTGLATLALYRTMKRRIRRPRPADAGAGVIARIAPLDQFSFPSGHTLHAVAFTVVGCFWFPSLASVLIPFTVLVALSRIVLGLHYPSDVLAAIGIGAAVAGGSLLIV
ncbi:MAG: phosphatase PAP2 family protein [Pseudomonadota bacterium]|nr:phosphatase PAP2 family protein [Pseudomonadota bacterium]